MISDFYNKLLTLTRHPQTQDEMGAMVNGRVVAGSVPGCLQETTAQERQVYGAESIVTTHKFWCPVDRALDIDHTMRLELSELGKTRVFKVQTTKNPQERDHHLRLMLEEIEAGTP